jgi:methionine sulfoxide reductase heme-binding subunit
MTRTETGNGRGGIDRDYVLWGVMAIPAVYIIANGLMRQRIPYVAWTGELASWFLILAMLVTPLMMLSRKLLWLKSRRRYFGVAAFGYSALHLAVWVAMVDVNRFLKSFVRPEILVGWIAFFVLVPLALTSFDRAVRALGPKWKTLQRWIYFAAPLILIHWLWTTDNSRLAILSSLPVIVFSIWRLARWQMGSQRV